MAKNKTEIHVTTVFDGELDATDVFVSLISQKYGKTNTKEYLAKKKDLKYNEDEGTTMSAPSFSGFWKYGDKKVLSTIRRRSCFFAFFASSSRSDTRIIGLVGVSA